MFSRILVKINTISNYVFGAAFVASTLSCVVTGTAGLTAAAIVFCVWTTVNLLCIGLFSAFGNLDDLLEAPAAA